MNIDLIKEFNLPSYTKGKSFADASKAIEAKFKGRNDKVSNETKQELLERLSQAQEYLKQNMEISNPQDQNQGMFGMDLEETGTEDGGIGVSGALGLAGGALELGNMAFSKSGIDTSGRTAAPDVNIAGGAMSGAMSGAKAGSALGPWGAAGGAVIGSIAGLIGGNKAKKDAAKANMNFDFKQSNNYRPNTYEIGGYTTDPKKDKKIQRNLNSQELSDLNDKLQSQDLGEGIFSNNAANYDPHNEGGIFATIDTIRASKPNHNLNLGKYKDLDYFDIKTNKDGRHTLKNTKKNPANAELYKEQLNHITSLNPKANIAKYNDSGYTDNFSNGGYTNEYTDGGGINFQPFGIGKHSNAEQTFTGKALNKTGEFLKNNYGSILRYAPLLDNLTNKIEKPITERGTRLDNVYKPQLFDEQQIVNQVNQNNVNKALSESSGGNLGALSTNLLAANLNKTKAISDAYMKGEDINRNENKFQFQSNLQKDTTNAQLNERYLERKAQDEGAYNTAKSAQRSALFEDIGNIGKEESYKKMVKNMFGYSWNGKYFVNEKGEQITKEDMDKKVKESSNGTSK